MHQESWKMHYLTKKYIDKKPASQYLYGALAVFKSAFSMTQNASNKWNFVLTDKLTDAFKQVQLKIMAKSMDLIVLLLDAARQTCAF